MTSPESSGTPGWPGTFSPEGLLAALVESSDDAIVSKNLSGIVTSWNAGAEHVFGYTAAEMIGRPITLLLPRENLDEENRILERLRRGERVDHYEAVRVRKDGRKIDVSLSISPIRNASGEVVGASKIARDITEQKLSLSKLAEAHEHLKRADRMKSEFISTLSHELRTPLTAIVGWVQILREGATPEELAQGLDIIDRNVKVQTQLINDLLDMSRIEAGKVSLDLQRIDLPAVVESALEAVRPAALMKNIRVTVAVSSIEGMVMADRGRMQQILWNLLNNAIKFTPKGGRVHVTVERVNSHVEIAVADNGVGISPDLLETIFERFSQADATITRRHGGLGLGLTIVRHLVELHGGKVHAQSQGAGRGATFVVHIPLVALHDQSYRVEAEERHAALDQTLEDAELHGVKVLAVDDDVDTLVTVQTVLKRRGAEVQIATSMEEGLAAFAAFMPHVILSDIGMPVHDGYEFIGKIRATPAGRSVPAVALTALARSEDRTRVVRAGFQMHVAKPVDAAELVAVVRNLADLRASLTTPEQVD
jgi:PAS domain S-box-containing protein